MDNNISFPISFGISKVGLPLVPIMIGDYALCLIIDTGSTLSLLDSSVADRLGDLAKNKNSNNCIVGIDGRYTQIEKSVDLTFNIGKHSFSHSFSCESLFEALIKFELESDIQVHGILGNDFLLKNKWIVDFNRLEVYSM